MILAYFKVQGVTPSWRRKTLVLSTLLALMAAGCGEKEGEERVPIGEGGTSAASILVTAELQAQIDSANAAYRVGEYALALERFKKVTESDPDLAAGWYGVGMTEAALGNRTAADSAMAQVHLLAPELPLAHPIGEAPSNPHP